jgi:hypothetical protein
VVARRQFVTAAAVALGVSLLAACSSVEGRSAVPDQSVVSTIDTDELILQDNPAAEAPPGWPLGLPVPEGAVLADSSIASPPEPTDPADPTAPVDPGWVLYLVPDSDLATTIASYKVALDAAGIEAVSERSVTTDEGPQVVVGLAVTPAVEARFSSLGRGVGVLFVVV